MKLHNRILALATFTVGGFLSLSQAQNSNEAIGRATAAMDAAAPRAQSDPAHPIFHITSPAQWMNDPNGPIYYKGVYHLFYQLHPFSDGDGPKYWGHVRSRDLVKWEHLPIALWPSSESGEQGVWSGCCTINGNGKPMIFYTSVAVGKSAMTHAEQWAAIGDADLVRWQKSPANPVLSEALHEGRKIYDWRDPFVFMDQHRTFLVTGGNLNSAKGGEAVVNIYEAQDPELMRWKYRGVLFTLPDGSSRTAECPNFFKLGDRWVLFVSPYGIVQYFVGTFDPATCRFAAQSRGLLDFGRGFYAPNTLQMPDGRRIVWGWINGFPAGHGWNGCLSLPRLLNISREGALLQNPAPQLTKLRGKPIEIRNVKLAEEAHSFALPGTNTFELDLDMELGTAENMELAFRNQSEDTPALIMSFTGKRFKMNDADGPLVLAGKQKRLRVRMFFDRSVLEVFANDTLCATRVIKPLGADARLEMRARGGEARATRVQAWPVNSIW